MVAIAKLFVASAAAVAVEGSQSCNSVCLKAGGVFGQIIGTAPACGASCANDCGSPHSICWTSSKDGGLVDYGHGCATGDKVCCCIGAGVGNSTESFPQPKQDTELIEIPMGHTDEMDQPQNTVVRADFGAAVESQSCNSVCQAAGHGSGRIKGTAPFCDASCHGDCPNGMCWTSNKDGGLVDYGSGCWSGDKVCCCSGRSESATLSEDGAAKQHPDVDKLSESSDQAELMEPIGVGIESAVGSQSCNSVCLAAGGVFGQIIGTAPACGASCANDCSSPHSICWTSSKDGGLVDYGHGCVTGDKVCCCIGAGGTVSEAQVV